MQKEASFGIRLRHYLRRYPLTTEAHIEVKDTRGKSYFAFSEVKEEQINNGLASKSDTGNLICVESGTIGAPDYCYFRNSPAYVVINYPDGFVFIDIERFVMEKESSARKSLTWDRAKEISVKTVLK